MAMTKPIALSKIAYNATENSVFSFTSSGGNQVVKNKITIRLNSDNSVIYTNTVESFVFSQTVPSNTLTNGTYYNYYFNTYDINDNESANSNVVSFYCYTTPIFTITNIPITNIINASNFTFNATYTQSESELLSFYQFILYNSSNTIITRSSELYNTNTPPFDVSYNVVGLEDNKNYYIEVIGYTINGTYFTSGKIGFSVNYYYPSFYSIIDLDNICEDGYTEITNNMILIDGTSNPSPMIYEDNSKVNLSTSGYYVSWSEGYTVADDFLARGFIYSPNVGEDNVVLIMKNSSISNEITINVKLETYGENSGKYFIELRSYGGAISYYAISNYVDTISHLMYWIRRVGNIYEIKLEELT